MKKALAVLALVALMIGSMGKGGLVAFASYYGDIEEAIPAQPEE